MRIRYFFITTFVLFLVSLFSLSAHNYLSQKDKRTNVDALLKQTAVTLMHADWANPERNDLQRVESILAQELGENELNRIFILRDATGKILYKSRIVGIFGLDGIPPSPEWLRLYKDDTEIRVYNLTSQRFPDRVLQVGLISELEQNTGFTDWNLALLFLSIGALGILSSWLLSGVLFSPISRVGNFLETATNALDKRGVLPNVPKELFMYLGKNDELRKLTNDLDSLLNKINLNYKTSRLWAAQMAHELKTPLSQLLLHLETSAVENDPSVAKSFAYIENIKNTINAFLDWAELENSSTAAQKSENVDVRSMTGMVAGMFDNDKRDRIVLKTEDGAVVRCNPNHFSQMAQNLISNALKYSEGDVTVTITKKAFKVSDKGAGMPPEVLEKIGDPFNFGNSKLQKKGHGLGLAWVKTICNLYGWGLQISSTPSGTEIAIYF